MPRQMSKHYTTRADQRILADFYLLDYYTASPYMYVACYSGTSAYYSAWRDMAKGAYVYIMLYNATRIENRVITNHSSRID